MEYDPVQIGNSDDGPARRSLRRPVVIAGFLLGVAALGMGAVVVMPHVGPGADESVGNDVLQDFFFHGPPAQPPNPHPHKGPNAPKCKGGKTLKITQYTGKGCPASKTIKVCFNNNKYSLGGRYGGPGRDKLQNPANFGPGGKVKYSVSVLEMKPPITKAALDANGCDIFQIGLSEAGAGGSLYHNDLSQGDVQGLKQWADGDPHHVVFGFQSYSHAFEGHYEKCKNGATNPMSPTPLGTAILDHGAFGDVGKFNQGGSWKGVLQKLDPESCVLIKDAKNWPIAVLDLSLGSVFMSDVDIITQLGGLTNGGGMSSQNDWVFGNFYGFLIGIVCNGPPAGCDWGEKGKEAIKICSYKPGPRPPTRRRRTRRRRSPPRRRRRAKPACCKALTAKCVACRLGMSKFSFCQLARCAKGCPPEPTVVKEKPVPPPPPPCDPTKPTWFCKRDPISYSHYPTCNEVNYGELCCIPNQAYLSGSKYQYSNCGKSRCKEGGPGNVAASKCGTKPRRRKCADEPLCIEEAKKRAANHGGNVACTGTKCDKDK